VIRRLAAALLVAAGLGPEVAAADDPDRFLVDDASDLVALCEVEEAEEREREALVFCHGFVVGALHYQIASTNPIGPRRWVCLPPLEARPSRDTVIREFVEWAKEHPEFMQNEAVDTLFRFLDGRFPCP
jgi:hypothetical protein